MRRTRPPHLAYVHGANGCGKSTLARWLIIAASGISRVEPCYATGAPYTSTIWGTLAVVGKYSTPTGGADGIQPYELVPKTALALLDLGYDVLVEGLLTPGVETCRSITQACTKLGASNEFILLDVSIEECTANVLKRRARKGNTKPYDNAHLIKKHRSSSNWAVNLEAAKLPIARLTWREARDHLVSAYQLDPDRAIGVLD